jgi:uncharacterized flavoprotein (TIGR03862 family)
MRAAVIGGGPAGLMAAERLSSAGIQVDIYDHMPSVGRKLLMAGRGGLNLTHSEPLAAFVSRYGDAQGSVAGAIGRFSPDALRAWADALGQETFVGSSGRVFPQAMKASPLLRAWLGRLAAGGVRIHTRHRWLGWDQDGALVLRDGAGEPLKINPNVTVLALGGASWPRLGSDANWVPVLSAEGIAVTPVTAANAGVKIAWSDVFRQRFEGGPVKRLSIACGPDTQVGEALVTRDGLEGGAVYALGPQIRQALARAGTAQLLIDVRPSFSHEELAGKLALPRKKQSTATFLRKAAGMAPIAIALTREGAGGTLPTDPVALAQLIKAIPLTVTGMGGLARAISTAGGVRFDALDDNLMLRVRPGVFIAGEMLDWDAPTGGYLLQATFATAVWAADGAQRWLKALPMR